VVNGRADGLNTRNKAGRVRFLNADGAPALLAAVAIAILISSVGPGLPAAQRNVSAAEQPAVLPSLTIIAPAAPGGGWDQLAREMQREIERQALTRVQVENVPGAAGTIGLAQLINGRRGDGGTLLVNGLVMLGAILWNQSPVSITQVTPIARLTGEYEVVAVPAASPHRDMQSLVLALRENPAAVSWGGGSAGGTDHILAGLIVAAAGVDPRRTNYIAFSGGGEAVTALIGGQVTAGISGYNEFAQHIESGRLRAIGISAPRRLANLDVPSFVEQGLDVALENWRAVVAPPGLNEAQKQTLTAVVERMAQSESWRATLTRLGWTDAYLAGPPLDQFLEAERVRVGRIVARLRGSAGDANAARAARWLFPAMVLGASALVLTLLFFKPSAAARDQRATSAPVGRVALGLVSFVALLNLAGFVAAGTVLFVCTASAFGSRRWLRDAVLGITLCATVYITFTYGLGVSLPPGLFLTER
jgi:putative tricarboxylic transport membrane protein